VPDLTDMVDLAPEVGQERMKGEPLDDWSRNEWSFTASAGCLPATGEAGAPENQGPGRAPRVRRTRERVENS